MSRMSVGCSFLCLIPHSILIQANYYYRRVLRACEVSSRHAQDVLAPSTMEVV